MRTLARVMVVASLALPLMTGCIRHATLPPCAQGVVQLELRNAAGELTWAVRDLGTSRPPSGARPDPSDATPALELALCDAGAHQHGAIWVRANAHRVGWLDANGRWQLELRGSAPDVVGTTLGKLRLRVHDDGRVAHVLDGEGVPFGSFTSDEHGAILVSDRASVPISRVESRAKDVSITRLGDGAVLGYVAGRAEPVRLDAAGLFALPILPEEQIALYYVWSTPPLR